MSQKLYESYEWIVPFETSTIQGKKVIIRGKAIHATVSKNLRQYVREELIEFGRTLAGKYIDVNHEYSVWRENKRRYDAGETAISPGKRPKLKGNVIDSQYNHLNGFVEYVAEVNHPEYAQKLIDRERMTLEAYHEKWGVNPITTVSVDANFRFKKDLEKGLEPHGIIGNGLSLVEDPESAGVEGTSLEVYEIRETQRVEAQFAILQNLLNEKNILTEVVGDVGERTLQRKREVKHVNTDEEKAIEKFNFTEKEWKKLEPTVKMNYIKETLKEQDECPEGQHRNEAGECVPDEVTEQDDDCPEGQHRNEEGECVPNEATELEPTSTPDVGHDVADMGSEEDIAPEHDCGEGMAWDAEAGACLPIKGQDAPLLTSLPIDVPPPEHPVPDSIGEQDATTPDTGHDLADIGKEDTLAPEHRCGEGTMWDDVAGKCVPTPESAPALLPSLPIDVEPPEHPVPDAIGTVTEEPTVISEWYPGYDSFADCVAKNSDKADPEAYCASIHAKGKGETLQSKIDEARNLHQQQLQGQSIAHLANKQEAFQKLVVESMNKLSKRNNKIVEAYNNLIKSSPCNASVKKLYEIARGQNKSINALNKAVPVVNRTLGAVSRRLNSSIDSQKTLNNSFTRLHSNLNLVNASLIGTQKSMTSLKETVGASQKKTQDDFTSLKETLGENLGEALTEIKTAIGALATIQETMQNEFTAFREDLPQLAKAEDITTLSNQLNQYKDAQGNAVEALNIKVTEIEKDESKIQEMRDLFTKYQEDKNNTLTETAERSKQRDVEVNARLDNLEEKAKKPAFKASATSDPEEASSSGVELGGRMNAAIG